MGVSWKRRGKKLKNKLCANTRSMQWLRGTGGLFIRGAAFLKASLDFFSFMIQQGLAWENGGCHGSGTGARLIVSELLDSLSGRAVLVPRLLSIHNRVQPIQSHSALRHLILHHW